MTFAGTRRGAVMALPFLASSFVYGIAFGVMAVASGLSGLEAGLMSGLVFSGTAQVAVLQAWSVTTHVLPLFLIVLIANIRYVLMGAALRPWLSALGGKAYLPLYFLVDGGFVIGTRSRADGDGDVGVLLGACVLSYFGWVAGTVLGSLSGHVITNPRAIGLDFIVLAFCASAAALMARRILDWWPALVATAVIVGLDWLAPGPWVVVAAGIAAAVVGALRYRVAETPTS